MEQPIKISIYTSVYNTKPYVAQCVESVLNQTYTNFEYIILDNGCTDGSSEILEEYARRDERIKLIRRDVNQFGIITHIILTCGDGDYMTILDSDDWLEPRFLERLAALAVANDLDMVCAKNYIYTEGSDAERLSQKTPPHPIIIRSKEFQSAFLQYRFYLSALWGKLVRTDVVRQAYAEPHIYATWAMDTVFCFRMLRRSNGIGIDSSGLYHYRVRANSATTAVTYQPTRFAGIVYLYEDLMAFLNGFAPALPENVASVGESYIVDSMETLEIAHNSNLSLPEKLAEYQRILGHPISQEIFQQPVRRDLDYPISRMIAGLLDIFLFPGLSEEEARQIYPQVRELLQAMLPRTHAAVTIENMPLLLGARPYIRAKLGDQKLHQLYMEHHRTFLLLFGTHSPLRFFPGNSVPLLQALAEDKPDVVLRRLKKLARKRGYAERYALPEAIRMLEQSLKETER